MTASTKHWTVSDLQHEGVLRIEDGNHGEYRPRQSEFDDVGTKYIRAADIVGTRVEFILAASINEKARARITKGIGAPGDVILSHKGTVGKVALVGNDSPPFVCSPQTTFWRTLDPSVLDRRYLFAFMRSSGFQSQLEAIKHESDMAPYVSLTTQRQLRITIPALAEQREIGSILTVLDEKIELNRNKNATLEAIARALFKSWFVDFDPVRAKAEGRDPGLPAEIAALFPNSFQETAHGKVPSGWRLVSLSEIVEINPTTSLAGISEAPYLDMSNVPTRGHAVDTVITRTVSSGSRFKLGDTLIARITPCLENGKTAFVDFLPEGIVGWGSTEFVVMRPRDPMPKEYGYLLSRSEAFRAYAISKMTGTSGRQRVPTDSLASYPVVQPCAATCAVFASFIQPFFRRLSAISLESRTLAALRDTLLPKLISGELRVEDADRVLAASA